MNPSQPQTPAGYEDEVLAQLRHLEEEWGKPPEITGKDIIYKPQERKPKPKPKRKVKKKPRKKAKRKKPKKRAKKRPTKKAKKMVRKVRKKSRKS